MSSNGARPLPVRRVAPTAGVASVSDGLAAGLERDGFRAACLAM
jgi:hypothetical protein